MTGFGVPSWDLELLDKLQKRICRTVGPSLATSLQPLEYCRNVASLSLFYRYYLVDIHLNQLNWFHFIILVGGLLVILIGCIIFMLPFQDVIRMTMSTISFLAQLDWDSLSQEFLPLIYHLNGFNSRVNRHLSLLSF